MNVRNGIFKVILRNTRSAASSCDSTELRAKGIWERRVVH